ncbi:uncharacterized protein LOC127737113 [Mytilus californianus]|uniref:uncharacterized protein LOC127737113 n=1 Tax=Mytilus californianus TaxID=6549 RepID=UPI0022461FC3|nr:uncharacterized protein LOC127737113 [Mytilus californianus]
MAHFGSGQRSQDILACGLCEVETKIKVKCMNCDLYMCQKCTDKIHAKFKNADLHDIVDLKDIHSHIDETKANSEFKPVKCKDHRKQLCCMYCLTCELLVCPMCIAKTHQLHLMEDIQTVCQKKVEEMKILQDQAKSKIEKLIENVNLMGEIEKAKSHEIEQNILMEEKQAREVQSKCLRLLKEHKDKTERQSELMSSKEFEILEDKKDIKTVIQQVENKYESRNTEEFLEAIRNMHSKLESIKTTSSKSFDMKILHYVPNYKIQTNSKSIEIEIHFETKAKYELNMLDVLKINSITSDKDGNIWITDGVRKIQQLQVKEGVKVIKALTTGPGFTEIRCWNKGILFTSDDYSKIIHLASNDKLKVFKNLSPSLPFALSVSENDVIVGMNCVSVKDKTDIPVIIRLGFNGKIIQIYKNHGRQLLTRDVVRCCTTTNDGAICYIDSINSKGYLGDVVFISRDAIIQWKYSGNSLINSNKHPFTPIEVVTTGSYNFIVSDENQHALHFLSTKGGLLTILDLTMIGVGDPGVMTIDNNGTLWISSEELNKTILSPVKFFGF